MDTHTLLWFLSGDDRLSDAARGAIEEPRNTILVSAASIWEMAIKASLGKLKVPANLLDVLREQGFVSLAVEPHHAWGVVDLPVGDHKDPFDRQLVAQALAEQLPIISGDGALDQYGVERLW